LDTPTFIIEPENSKNFLKLKLILKELKEEKLFQIYVYCFMTNHIKIHLGSAFFEALLFAAKFIKKI